MKITWEVVDSEHFLGRFMAHTLLLYSTDSYWHEDQSIKALAPIQDAGVKRTFWHSSVTTQDLSLNVRICALRSQYSGNSRFCADNLFFFIFTSHYKEL